MDLGIKGRTALVCASSKGLGRGCAEALPRGGADFFFEPRGEWGLEGPRFFPDTLGFCGDDSPQIPKK
ncbi:MAG: hypothetical protein CM15mP103_07920 [Gammaproteobacteria bacterium]|nr:MAG: hypothetical protein CM15mP103_07920 [Gammaproteobacteria bacterium]